MAQTTLSDIAEAAGIAKGTLHYYYKNKSDLLFELAERHSVDLSKRFIQLAETHNSQTERNAALNDILSEIMSGNRSGILIHLLIEGATGNGDLQEKFRTLYQEWSSTILEGFQNITGSTISSEQSDIILSSLIGLIFNTVVTEKTIDPDLFLRFLLSGVRE